MYSNASSRTVQCIVYVRLQTEALLGKVEDLRLLHSLGTIDIEDRGKAKGWRYKGPFSGFCNDARGA